MHEPPLFRMVLIVLLVAFVVHRAYYTCKFPARKAETISQMASSAQTMTAGAVSLVALLASLIYVFSPSHIAWASAPFAPWMRWIGVFVAVLGFALLEWSHRSLSENWSDRPRITATQKLVRTGPYTWVRHPIYSAFLMILGSTLPISANWFLGLAWLIGAAMEIVARVRFEDSAMQKRFGRPYEDYKRKTGALVPRIDLRNFQ